MKYFILSLIILGIFSVAICLVILFKRPIHRRALAGWAGVLLLSLVSVGAWFVPVQIKLDASVEEIRVTIVGDHPLTTLEGSDKAQFLTVLSATLFRREFFESTGLRGDESYYHIIIQSPEQLINLDLYVPQGETTGLVRADSSLRAIAPNNWIAYIVPLLAPSV